VAAAEDRKNCAEATAVAGGVGVAAHATAAVTAAATAIAAEGVERIVQLYDAWGKKDQADTWRKKLEEARKPGWPPPPGPS
jgi:hypothetical protein